jgi:hypothetical protein
MESKTPRRSLFQQLSTASATPGSITREKHMICDSPVVADCLVGQMSATVKQPDLFHDQHIHSPFNNTQSKSVASTLFNSANDSDQESIFSLCSSDEQEETRPETTENLSKAAFLIRKSDNVDFGPSKTVDAMSENPFDAPSNFKTPAIMFKTKPVLKFKDQNLNKKPPRPLGKCDAK